MFINAAQSALRFSTNRLTPKKAMGLKKIGQIFGASFSTTKTPTMGIPKPSPFIETSLVPIKFASFEEIYKKVDKRNIDFHKGLNAFKEDTTRKNLDSVMSAAHDLSHQPIFSFINRCNLESFLLEMLTQQTNYTEGAPLKDVLTKWLKEPYSFSPSSEKLEQSEEKVLLQIVEDYIGTEEFKRDLSSLATLAIFKLNEAKKILGKEKHSKINGAITQWESMRKNGVEEENKNQLVLIANALLQHRGFPGVGFGVFLVEKHLKLGGGLHELSQRQDDFKMLAISADILKRRIEEMEKAQKSTARLKIQELKETLDMMKSFSDSNSTKTLGKLNDVKAQEFLRAKPQFAREALLNIIFGPTALAKGELPEIVKLESLEKWSKLNSEAKKFVGNDKEIEQLNTMVANNPDIQVKQLTDFKDFFMEKLQILERELNLVIERNALSPKAEEQIALLRLIKADIWLIQQKYPVEK